RPGPHGMGVDTDADTGQLLTATGALASRIYAIGTLRRGTLWESTAIPEIRSEARRLAALLVV
ncbi:MAG: pyridine nucleotide-disulfide oxidoreductase, partial [Actinobacteria bacterium]|nr:pyridine nucleotide-disulfide oxidoreductase [Actinomycetota bacterium]